MNKNIMVSVTASLIASIVFFLFFQPLLEGLPEKSASFITNIYNGYEEVIYGNASLGMRNYVGTIVYRNLLMIIWPIYIGVAVGAVSVRFMRKSDHKTIIAAHNKIQNMADKSRSNLLSIILFFWFAVTLLSMSYYAIVFYADTQMNTSFNHRLMILKPHIDLQDEEELTAKWALMKNRNDYDAINKNLENYAKRNNIILPKKLWE